MIKKSRFYAGYFVIGVTLFATILLCTRDYNPFEDPSNAKAVFSYKSFNNGDTLNIFTRETLSVSLHVPELIDSFVVDAPDNRFFKDDRIVYKSGGKDWQGAGPYNLILSFKDTGNKVIELRSYQGDEEITNELQCYIRSPLHQDKITGALNELVNLHTKPVGDKDVIYLWDFGRGTIIKSMRSDTSVVVENAGKDGKGKLKVSDGLFTSPEVPFTFGLIDTIPPKISFTEDNYIKVGDTIKTSKIDFNFTVVISDHGNLPDSVSINGKNFDKFVDDSIYIKMLGRIDTLTRPVPLIIYAMDNMNNRNIIVDTVFLIYDPLITLHSKAIFDIFMPEKDSSVCNTRNRNIYGYISQFSEKSFNDKILFSINNKIKDSINVTGENKKTWSWTVPLDYDVNIIKATLFNESGDSLSSLKRVILYNKDAVDTTPPIILEITTDGENNDFTVEDSTVNLKVLAFDATSRITTLYVNGKAYTHSENNMWTVMAENLRHIPGGNICTIKAVDSARLHTDTTIIIYRNSPPKVIKDPRPPLPLVVGTDYYDSILVSDPDEDSVTIEKVKDSTGLTISNAGKIHWRPGINDTGEHVIKVSLSDNNKSVGYSFKIFVIDSLHMRSVVKFDNLLGRFPKYLIANRDSLSFTLSTVPGTGKEPFIYHALVIENSLSLNVDSNRVRWYPVVADTGLKHLKIWVTDFYNNSDTLFPSVNIIPNDTQIYIFGNISSVDMSALGKKDTLSYVMHVSHSQTDGHFSVYSYQDGVKNTIFVDSSGNFSVVFSSADKQYGYDTLKLLGQYADLLSDTLKLPVFYGYQPVTPSVPYPAIDTIINDSVVNFSWNGNKANEKGIYYNLYLGSCPEPQSAAKSNFVKYDTVLHRSGTYCWRVSASNGKAITDGPVWRFRLKVPGQVKFLTNETDFKAAYEARRDSINVPLKVVQGTGKSPFVFNAVFSDNNKLIPVINGRISFLPDSSDTGYKKIIVTVNDSLGNSDTIMPVILITPVNRRCEVHLDTTGLPIKGGKLDLSLVSVPVTLKFKISDPDPEITERHTITISQLNTVVNGKDDSLGNIYVIVDPSKADVTTDLLKVKVADRAGYTWADSITIYYGLPPQIPYNPLPQDNSVSTDAITSLGWNCSDPDGHLLSYDLYFGTTNPPQKKASGIAGTSYILPNMIGPGKYFWKVIANDSKFTVQSPVWSFTVDSVHHDFLINTTYGGDGAGISHILNNIPVLLRLDTTNFNFKSVSHNGADLWFTRDSSSQPLPHEIDSWDSASGQANVWILLDKLNPFNNTQFIRLHTNSPYTSTGQVFDTSNGFEGVWHLEDSSSGIGTQNVYKDMTQNKFNGDDFVNNNSKDGIIGKGEQFNGTGDRIRLPQNINALSNDSAISAEAWFKSGGSPFWQSIICISDSDFTQPRMELDINNQGKIFVNSYILNNDPASLVTNSSYTDNNWHYVIGIIDFRTKEIIVYVDGIQAGIYHNTFLPDQSYASKSAMSSIGSRATGTEYFMKGSLDEVRISSVRRTPDWMKFCYMNQKPGSKVVTLRKVN